MATPPSHDGNNLPKKPKKQLPKVPEERFWKRYSPHHEFPLSLSSSLFLHIVGLVILIFGGVLLALIGLGQNNAIAVDAVTIAGGGGNPDGVGNEKGDGAIPTGPEAVSNDRPPEVHSENPSTEQLVTPQAVPPIVSQSTDNDRAIEEAKNLGSRLTNLSSTARQKFADYLAGKGKGGTGSGGGKGSGKGTGEGDLQGPGKNNLTQREKRKARWVMLFTTSAGAGHDYLRQLEGLGAILAFPTGDDKFLVIRDLRSRPFRTVEEDIKTFNMIWWVDDKSRSVESLADALGVRPVPDYFVAFFPVKLENQLLEKELQAFRGNEEDIDETVFKVERRNGQYEPVVSQQKARRR